MFETLITFQAHQRPDALAISTPAGDITYAALDADADRIARHLMPLLPQERSRIAVQVQNPNLHWLVLLALARLGHASASLPPVTMRPVEQLLPLLRPALLLSDTLPGPPGVKTAHLSPEWVNRALQSRHEPVEPYRFADEEPVRVMLSSGTTGLPKTIVWTRAVLDRRLQTGAILTQMAGRRNFIQQGLDTDGGFRGALLLWTVGGTVLYAKAGFDWMEVITGQKADCIGMAPAQLAGLLQSLPPGFPPQPQLSIILGGGSLPQAVSARARASLTPNIHLAYGSTEAGVIAVAPAHLLEGRPGATGFATPWSQVEVVDDADRPLPPGRSGRIRTRSEEMVSEYEGDPETTRSAFKDGWFYPGDMGVIEADGCLVTQGRVSEVMDLNGYKLAPEPVEEVALACPGVRDAAAVAIPDGDGRTRGFVGVTVGPGYQPDVIAARLREQFSQVGLVAVELATIARSAPGKIRRDKVCEAVAAKLGAPPQA